MLFWVKEMLDDEKLEEIKKNIAMLRNEDEITKDDNNKKLAEFYVENAFTSLNTAPTKPK